MHIFFLSYKIQKLLYHQNAFSVFVTGLYNHYENEGGVKNFSTSARIF